MNQLKTAEVEALRSPEEIRFRIRALQHKLEGARLTAIQFSKDDHAVRAYRHSCQAQITILKWVLKESNLFIIKNHNMSNERINEKAHEFLNDKVGYHQHTAMWYRRAYRFDQLSMNELQHLSGISNTPVRELVSIYGFGVDSLTIHEMDTFLKEEGEGYRVIIAEQSMEAA